MEEYNLVKNTLDQIPNAKADAKRIVGLVKKAAELQGINCLIIPLWKNSRRLIWQSKDKSPV